VSTFSLWALLPWQVISVLALAAVSQVVARPGERLGYFATAMGAWVAVQVVILGFGSMAGWVVVTS
jgi:hypothetical protein